MHQHSSSRLIYDPQLREGGTGLLAVCLRAMGLSALGLIYFGPLILNAIASTIQHFQLPTPSVADRGLAPLSQRRRCSYRATGRLTSRRRDAPSKS